jgi:hypothetical protein
MRTDHGSDRDAIVMTVLAHMVTNAADNRALIRFVELPSQQIPKLCERCGSQYVIFSAQMAQQTSSSVHLKDSDREGVIIHVEIETLEGDNSTVVASYTSSLSDAGFRYKLRRIGGTWRIVSAKNTVAT